MTSIRVEYKMDLCVLLESGPLIHVIVDGEPVMALIDLGSNDSFIDTDYAMARGFPVLETLEVITTRGEVERLRFYSGLEIPFLRRVVGPPLTGAPLLATNQPFVVILGRYALEDCELTVNLHDGTIRLALVDEPSG